MRKTNTAPPASWHAPFVYLPDTMQFRCDDPGTVDLFGRQYFREDELPRVLARLDKLDGGISFSFPFGTAGLRGDL
jgi:hypothetical protein